MEGGRQLNPKFNLLIFIENKWKTQQRSLEGEKKDFKFVLEQKDLKHKKLIDENVALKSKLDLVLSKVYNPYN